MAETEFFGFRYWTNDDIWSRTRHIRLSIRLWTPFLLFSVYPVYSLVLVQLVRARRRAKKQCVRCAYSMVGNELGVCPECGLAWRDGVLPQWARIVVSMLLVLLGGIVFEYFNNLLALESRVAVMFLRWFEVDPGSWVVFAGVRSLLYGGIAIGSYLYLTPERVPNSK